MKVAHVCLSCFYIDGFSYQENELVRQHVESGEEVVVIASTETYGADRALTYVQPSTYMGSDGARVIRLPYRKLLPHAVMRKLRMHPGVYELLCELKPDVILFHGLCGWELHAVARYKRENRTVKLYVDSHEDHNNSARTFVSKHILHRLYYAWVIRRCLRYFDKILCVSLDTVEFVKETYSVPEDDVEWFPLGGHIFGDEEYVQRRLRGRRRADVHGGQVLVLQTGKMGRRKRILESLSTFTATEAIDMRLVLAGSFDQDVQAEALAKVAADPRISFLGWQSAEELKDLLCAADLYVQPGTQSATMQMSLCARCPVVLEDVLSHRPFVAGNGWLIANANELQGIFRHVAAHPEVLEQMSSKSLEIARRVLDYRVLAARILQPIRERIA